MQFNRSIVFQYLQTSKKFNSKYVWRWPESAEFKCQKSSPPTRAKTHRYKAATVHIIIVRASKRQRMRIELGYDFNHLTMQQQQQ